MAASPARPAKTMDLIARVAKHFEDSELPAILPRWLPDDWKGCFVLLLAVFSVLVFLVVDIAVLLLEPRRVAAPAAAPEADAGEGEDKPRRRLKMPRSRSGDEEELEVAG